MTFHPEMLKKAQNKAVKSEIKNIDFLQSDGTKIQLEDESVDLVLLVTVFHEVGESLKVLPELHRILNTTDKLAIVEVVKKGLFPSAPVQNPETLTAEVEAGNFKPLQLQHYKSYSVFLFTKNGSQ
jgi:ubiquinone/menaquinone biosynthesis C-methylase UbiE